MWKPRPGQWVTFKVPKDLDKDFFAYLMAFAHVNPDGDIVGIFQPYAIPPVAVLKIAGKDANPPEAAVPLPPRIYPCDKDGYAIRWPQVHGISKEGNIWIPIVEAVGVRPIIERDHIPAHRLQHCPDWNPTV